jgi:hypothetical protein
MKSLKRISFLFLIAISFVLNSCSNESIDPAIDPSANNGSSSGMLRWSCKVDGVLHEWSGSFGASSGLSNYSKDEQNATDGNPNGVVVLSKSNSSNQNELYLSLTMPDIRTGAFSLNGNSVNNAAALTLSSSLSYGTVDGQTISVNITELSNNTAITGDLSGRVKGTFSGSMRQVGSLQTITITEGSFEAIRMQ